MKAIFTSEELQKLKEYRGPKNYHDMIIDERNSDTYDAGAYNRAISAGREKAQELMKEYQNPSHPNHERAKAAMKVASYNEEQLENNYINDMMDLFDAKKFETKNVGYENAMLNAVQNFSGTEMDQATVTAWKSYMKEVFDSTGYESYNPVVATRDFFKSYPCSFEDKAIERVENVFNKFFPVTASRKMLAGLRDKNDITNMAKKAFHSRNKKEEDKQTRDKRTENSKTRNKLTSVIANKMAKLSGKGND